MKSECSLLKLATTAVASTGRKASTRRRPQGGHTTGPRPESIHPSHMSTSREVITLTQGRTSLSGLTSLSQLLALCLPDSSGVCFPEIQQSVRRHGSKWVGTRHLKVLQNPNGEQVKGANRTRLLLVYKQKITNPRLLTLLPPSFHPSSSPPTSTLTPNQTSLAILPVHCRLTPRSPPWRSVKQQPPARPEQTSPTGSDLNTTFPY